MATVSQDPESLRLKAVIERRHPEYVKNIISWQFLRQAVEGGEAYLEGNLFQHPQEDPKVFAARSKRAADNHFNLCQLVNDTYEGYVFQDNPALEEGLPPIFTKFVDEADSNGKPLISLAHSVMHWMDTYGVVWVCVDKPAGTPEVSNAAQELAVGNLPYGYVVHPTHVLNGHILKGIPQWLLIQEDVLDNSNPWQSSNEIITQWRLWEPLQWTLIQMHINSQGQEVYTATVGVNDLGEVPFVKFSFEETDGFACKSLLSDIARMDRAIFNKCSLLDEIHYAATFPQLTIPYRGDLYDDDGLNTEGKAILTMGLNSVLPFNAENGAPAYISPLNGPADSLEGNIDKMSKMALSLSLLDGEISKSDAKTASSGVSKAYIFEKLNRRLATIADTLHEGFWHVFRLVSLWMGQNPDDLPSIIWAFPDSFEVRSLAQEIADTISLLTVGVPSDLFKQTLFKAMVAKAYPDLTKDEYDAINAEIDSFDYSTMDVHWQMIAPDPMGIQIEPQAGGSTAKKAPGASRAPNPNHDPIAAKAATNAANGISQAHGGRNNGKTG